MSTPRSFELKDEQEPGRVIRGLVDLPPAAAPRGPDEPMERRSCVVLLHGFKGFMHWGFFPELARRFAADGHVVVRFNASGSGVGPGDPEVIDDDEAFARNTPSRLVEDIDRVHGWLTDGGVAEVDARRLGFCGHSMGGGAGLVHASRCGGWRAIVTLSAVSRFDRFEPAVLEAWRSQGFLYIENARTGQKHRLERSWLDDIERSGEALNVPGCCASVRAPTLLLHGEQDESVPIAEGRRLLAGFPLGNARLQAIAEAGHTFGARHPFGPEGSTPELEQAIEHALEHFARWLRQT